MAVERNPNEATRPSYGNAEVQPDEDGGVIVELPDEMLYELGDEPEHDPLATEGFYANLVEELDEDALKDISIQVLESFEADLQSRSEWEESFEKGLDLLGLKFEDTDEPFEGACTAVHPLLIESAVSFQSKSINELYPAGGPVKTQIMGKASDEKEQQAERVKTYMNYQITEMMPEYFDETERMLFHLPLFGSGFKKIYFDIQEDRPVNEFVPIDQFVVSNFAVNLRKADRYTQVLYRSPVQLEREILSGMYIASDDLLDDPAKPELSALRTKMDSVMGLSPTSDDYDGQYTLLEQHCYLDIEKLKDETELTLPYIVTVDKDSGAVLSIRRNYDEDDVKRKKKLFFTHYRFVPAFGFYGIGYMHMLGNLTASATSAMRALLDAGQFANLPAGFKAKGIRIAGDNEPIAPGEFREIEATGMDLSKAIIPLPYKEPSQTLFAMLQFVATAGQHFADNTEQVISDSASYGPVGTTMALLEASSKFFSAVHKRLHHAQREELRILARINSEYMPEAYPYEVGNDAERALKDDFNGRVDIIPVSDPNVPSAAHRMMMAQMALQLSQQAPAGMYDVEELHRTILRAANIPNLDRILPDKPQAQPLDPVSDIMAATKGMPIRAFAGQDHDAHVKVKMAYMQDPENGQNPIMQRIVPILAANIQEHSVMKYQEQMNGMVNQMIGAQEQDKGKIEQAQAQAAQQVVVANQQAAKGPPTPEEQMVQLESRRVDNEEKKIEAQAAKDAAQAALKTKELSLKEMEMAIEAFVAGATNLMKMEENEKDRQAKQINEAIKVLADLAKHNSQLDVTKHIQKLNSMKEGQNEEN
jgi:hypothetical protein